MSNLPICFEPTRQNRPNDCAVACLKMLTGVTYVEATDAFPKRAKVATEGASDRQILNAAKRLRRPLRFIKDGDLSEIVGILQIIEVKTKDVHVVMLAKGSIYNPGDGVLWTDIDSFLKAQYTIGGVFVLREDS